MQVKRIIKHLLTTSNQVAKAFPADTLRAIELAISAGELGHTGEIRFAVEEALDGMALFKGQTSKERAIELFSQLRVWDTELNNGLLIYLLLADHAVEIVADRGINAKVGPSAWKQICRQMETDFKQSNYLGGVINGVQAASKHLASHFPATEGRNNNELQDRPVLV